MSEFGLNGHFTNKKIFYLHIIVNPSEFFIVGVKSAL